MSTTAETPAQIQAKAQDFLTQEVAPKANLIDSDPTELRHALQGLCDHHLMALRRPNEYGGPAFPEQDFRFYQESVARYSGSLAFLQTQHQSAVAMISKCDNKDLKQRYLPHMHDGTKLVGIGFSQLRRPGPPMVTATPTDNGYIINGTVPWVTGHTFYHDFLIGAALPSGESLYGVVPFTDTQEGDGQITFDGPMRLAAMESPQTMTAKLNNWLLPSQNVAFIKPDGWIKNNDMINVTLQAWFALGCARAGLDIVHKAYEKRKADFILNAYNALDQELINCRTEAQAHDAPIQDRLTARAWAIDLSARCAHAAVTASSGAANSIHHNAQRVYREALVYTVSAQNARIMEATLKRLVERGNIPESG